MRVISCLCALLGGCFLHHRDTDSDARPIEVDAGFDSDPFDASVDSGFDAEDADASRCRAVSAVELCLPPSFTEPLSRFSLTTDDCHCEGSLVCHVAVLSLAAGGLRGQLQAELEVCDELDCRACSGPTTVECVVPPAPAGDYHVRTDDGEFLLTGLGSWSPSDPVVRMCQSVGPVGGLCELIGAPYAPSEVCLTPGAPIVVRGGSSCVFDPGPCTVEYIDGRPESSISIVPRQRSCDESEPVWDCATWQCPAAPADGHVMTVYAGGSEVGVFDPEGGEQCFMVPGPIDG